MSMKEIDKHNEWARFPAFYNLYPIHNEIHPTLKPGQTVKCTDSSSLFADTFYGRLFSKEYFDREGLYGCATEMNYYLNIAGLSVVDEYRVPYRKIPIYQADLSSQIKAVYTKLQKDNPGYKILLRGQTKSYFIQRSEDENNHVYGEPRVKEPSFLPSYLRAEFDELFMQSMWHNQAAILLNDIGYDYEGVLPNSILKTYWNDVDQIRNGPLFTPFSLGIAQHYGLPSVGLDLTDSIEVSSWFALNSITVRDSGYASASLIDAAENVTAMIFVFRCPQDAVYNYRAVRPHIFPNTRPDKQNAWFGHVGWGAATNQLASYLMCGFRLNKEYVDDVATTLPSDLFPKLSDDPVLEFFVKLKNQDKYEGEAKRALDNIYYFE